ncbi:MAG TPA: alpha/beta hydrolase family protein [Bryobacteraceae bacterium]|nr:alpha/beta hydrolase family protein [Bryobacteraceae bacterium]
MTRVYGRWMEAWENRLCFRATNRVVRPFEWGAEFVNSWPVAAEIHRNGHGDEAYLIEVNRRATEASESFYGYAAPRDFRLSDDNLLTFSSPVETPWDENNKVHAQWFPASPRKGERPRRAVVVLPHWNAPAGAHIGLAKGISKLGISALRLSLPYHDFRMPGELRRADYAVSSNIGRTIDATRQAVIDARACLDWLEGQGYERLGIVGTSLGSCYAFLTATHDPRIRVNVFNHCSAWFGDVVWTGLSTRHIRETLEQHLDVARLRDLWRAISPVCYIDKFAALKQKSLFLYTRYDTTFLPEFSRQVVATIARTGVEHKVVVLPCGHYTLGEFPFKYVAGYQICSFLARNL